MQEVADKKIVFRVVLVEDDPSRIRVFTESFSPMALIVTEPNGLDAYTYLEMGNPVDLVVFNDSLGCLPFLKAVDANPYLFDLSIVLLSTDATIKPEVAPYRKYIVDVFTVDYSAEALRRRLEYFVQKKQYQTSDKGRYKPAPIRMPVGKRIFDIVVSFTALLMLSPLLLIVAILIRIDSKGPIFYRSKRVGTGYKIFDMYKFRTMRTGADKLLSGMASQNMYNTVIEEEPEDNRCENCQLAGTDCQRPLFLDNEQVCELIYHRNQKAKATFMKFKEDPRVTGLGKFLRNASIDELPQLINIFKGDMSFVGNRPLPPYEAEKLTVAGYARRFAAPAGLTGLWQVTKRGKASVSDLERIQLDVLYAKKYSFKTDFIIMLKTVKALFQKENV